VKRTFYLALLLLTLVVLAYGFRIAKASIKHERVTTNITRSSAPAIVLPEPEPPVEEKTPLNLALPKTEMLMDNSVALPDKPQRLHQLFEPNPKDDAVSVGGRLLVDENPKPNAGMLDKVKGAEVGITIKTP